MFPPGLEPRTFRVLGERDNHYTTETQDKGVCALTPFENLIVALAHLKDLFSS